MNGTVKQFKDILEEMKTIYPYKDDKTRMSTNDILTMGHGALEIITKDEKTGVTVTLAKRIPIQRGE